MGAFLGISLWVALATVVPGLITIATIYGAVIVINPTITHRLTFMGSPNDWVCCGFAITVMVLTQAIGILLEKILVDHRKLGDEKINITIEEGIDPLNPDKKTTAHLKPYEEYDGIYILLAALQENEDTQGHLKRVLAQFFLTNNTLVSFGVGILVAVLIALINPTQFALLKGSAYIGILAVCLWLSYKVAKTRFKVMAKALWAAGRVRLANARAG